VFIANVEMKVSFLTVARVGSMLTCTALVVGGGNRATFVEAEVVDDTGRAVARASSTYLLTARG
jgi:acyl-coenzyme A thioesterase PaaI-like protein